MEKSSQQWKKVRETKFTEYWVSDMGNCRAVEKKTGKAYEYKGYYNKYIGYMQFAHEYVHRLVAEAFLPNPAKLEQVDHLNSDRTDNRVANLQWISRKANNTKDHAKEARAEACRNARKRQHRGMLVKATKDGETRVFKNGYICAESLGCTHVHVYKCLNGAGSARRCKGWTLEWIETPQA